MQDSENDDATLATRCAEYNDRQAFADLVYRYQHAIVRLAWGYAGNQEDAEDLAQDVFLRVWERIGQYDRVRPFKPWLYQVAANVCKNWLAARKARGAGNTLPLDDAWDVASLDRPENEVVKRQQIDLVYDALGEMPETARTAISLRFLEGFTFQEIATIMSQPLPTVASHVRRGLTRLRDILERRGVEGE